MKISIACIWVDNYSNVLKNTCLNFGSEAIFNIKLEEGKVNILVEENPDFISNFFQNDNTDNGISNISAILGKNGTGKSMFCKLLRDIVSGGASFPFVIIYRKEIKNKKIEFILDNYSTYSLKIKKNKNINLKINSNKKPKPINFGGFYGNDSWRGIEDTEIIYYSPIVDYSNIETLYNNTPNGIDVSINNLTFQDLVNHEYEVEKLTSDNFLIVPRAANFKRQYEMIHQFQSLKLPNGPFQIHTDDITIQIIDIDYNISKINDSGYGSNIPYELKKLAIDLKTKFITENRALLLKRSKINRNERETKKELVIDQDLFVLDFCERILRFYFSNVNADNQNLNTSSGLDNFNFGEMSFIDSVELFLSKQKLFQGRHLITSINLINEQKRKIEFVYGSIKRDKIKLDKDNTLSLFINNLNAIIELRRNGIGRDDKTSNFIHFDWGKANSSGEKSMLDLFSCLFYAKQKIVSNIKSGSFTKYKKQWPNLIVLLLDEAEVGFHPEWQKQYISLLIENIPWIFANIGTKKEPLSEIKFSNIQIFITSHSPFPLSDLPINNVNFFDKIITNNEIQTISNYGSKIGMENSFGANIHDLFSQSFFLKDDFIGSFARMKIEEVIKKLNSTQVDFDHEELKKTINLIGEPFIKEQLTNMYNDKFYTDDEQIEELEKKLKQLKDAKFKRK